MKQYDKWNEIKKETEKNKSTFIIKVREIYWLKIGQNIGYEVYGKGEEFLRPVLIVRKFSKESFLGIPLTSSFKNDMFHFKFTPISKTKTNFAMLSQVKLFSTKRIHDKMGKISTEDFESLKMKLKDLIGL
ncbi:MAG: type II toxin-antitoxin system PemK/MazF family toxin [Campylobacterota bacterium]|nr:type II toxin-antitoxin system PemK/MazF family toxin [Campylobacterota bacterium]